MEYLLTKLLPLFVYPLGLAIVLGIFGLVLLVRGHHGKAGASILLGVLILWGSATNAVSARILISLEGDFPAIPVEQQPNVDAIVVLGGFTGGGESEDAIVEINDAVDRLFHGVRLYRAGKAQHVMLLGGAARGKLAESHVMAGLLAEFGVSREVMLLEDKSRNTRENALNALAIMKKKGINKILLVTSAFHMHRASAVFEKLGLEVVPAATDYQVQNYEPSILDWVPDAEALMGTTLGIKEYLGWWVYWFRGWV
jgi:uncharacterized SAM-binding protein YcdF (DUF218 family)